MVAAAAGVSPAALGFAAGCLALVGTVECWRAGRPGLAARAPRLARAALALADTLVAAGRDGRDPGAGERRRLLAAGAAVAFAGGLIAIGLLAGLALAVAGPWAAARALRA